MFIIKEDYRLLNYLANFCVEIQQEIFEQLI